MFWPCSIMDTRCSRRAEAARLEIGITRWRFVFVSLTTSNRSLHLGSAGTNGL